MDTPNRYLNRRICGSSRMWLRSIRNWLLLHHWRRHSRNRSRPYSIHQQRSLPSSLGWFFSNQSLSRTCLWTSRCFHHSTRTQPIDHWKFWRRHRWCECKGMDRYCPVCICLGQVYIEPSLYSSISHFGRLQLEN